MAGPSTFARHITGGIVREMWPDEALNEEIIEEEPILGMCKKETDWGTGVVHHPLGWGGNQGIHRTAAGAKRLKSHATEAEFQLSTREMFAFLSLEGKLLRAFEYTKQKYLLVDPIKREGERAIERMRRRFSKSIHGNGIGILGRITSGSTVSTNTITLTDANDLKNFEKDTPIQTIGVATTGGTLNDGGAEALVYSIGTEDSPTVTLSVAWNAAFPEIAASDYIVGAGQYDDDYLYGLDAFLPNHSGSPGTLLTCDRNVNPGWLAGRCMDGRNLSVYQRIKQAARKLVDAGEKPKDYLLSTRNFEKFEFENKPELVKFPAEAMGKMKLGIEYTGAVVQGPRGPIRVIPTHWMPDDVERCGDISTLTMGSIGPLVHWDADNGPKDLRTEDGTDNRELRAVSDPAFLVKRPGAWMRVRSG
jgi:hypothetical protein